MSDKENRPSGGIVSKISTIILTLICVALAVIVGYRMLAPEEAVSYTATTQESEAVNVSVTTATSGSYDQLTRVYGQVVADRGDLSVMSEVSGTLTEVLVKRGDRVEAGQVVAYVNASRPGQVYEASPVTAAQGGIVTSIDSLVGTTVSTTTSIMTIYTDRELSVDASIGSNRASQLVLGGRATFTSASNGQVYEAVLSYLSPQIDTSTRTVDLEFSITGGGDGLKEGDFVTMDVVSATYDDVIVIPASAVNRSDGNAYVYVVKDGVAIQTYVTVLASDSQAAAISEGVSEGDQVITSGTVVDGTSVSIVG